MSNMVVNTNILALNSHRSLKITGTAQAKSSSRLSSGMKINSAADDAAGLAISEKMRAQVRGLDMASKNAQDGISMVQTAEGGMQEIQNMLQRQRELSVQSKNSTNTDKDIEKMQEESTQLGEEIVAMAGRVEFNTKVLLTAGDEQSIQVGANDGETDPQVITFTIEDLSGLGAVTLDSGFQDFDDELEKVSKARADLGAVQNRLEYTIKSLDISSENLSASESRIRDTDMAKEMMNLTKTNVLSQAATSMLAQANQAPQSVLKLLQ